MTENKKVENKVNTKEEKKVEVKETKKVETKKVDTKTVKVENKTPTTNAGLFQLFGVKGTTDRKAMAQKIFEEHKIQGRETSKGKPITLEKIHQQVSAMVRDIKNERKGWWSTYTVVEDDKSFKLVKVVGLPKTA